tara:strand:+ start:6470 stop:6760 length:291 start_codon:yes stop_codon:yes gene_type:complete
MSFREYYKYYLSLHKNKWNRMLHAFGQFMTILYIISVIYSGILGLLLFAPFVVYPFAWSGHYFFEKNKPAAFSRPLWAKACDWVMLKDMIAGNIHD